MDGSELTNDQGFIQDWLSMPLNTSNTKLLNLPDKRTGSRSSPPYIKIYGIYENNKSKEKISLSISGKDPLNLNGKKNFVAEFNLSKSDLSHSKDHQPIYNFPAEGDLILNLDKKNYTISDQLLYEKYIKSEIIDRNDFFSPRKFIEISNKFFKYVKKMSKPDFAKYNKTSFELYILPETGVIKYLNPVMLLYNKNGSKNIDNNNKLENNSMNRSTSNKNKETGFIDCFGNKCSQLASTSTQTAKFLSFDDPAFTINCIKKRNFTIILT